MVIASAVREAALWEPRRGDTSSAQGEALGMADHNVHSPEGAVASRK